MARYQGAAAHRVSPHRLTSLVGRGPLLWCESPFRKSLLRYSPSSVVKCSVAAYAANCLKTNIKIASPWLQVISRVPLS